MGYYSLLLLLCLSWSFFILGTHQLQSSQAQVLLQLKKHLEYPKQLEVWNKHSIDFCYISSAQVNITCENDFVTELEIMGDKPVKTSFFNGVAVPNQTLSENFSIDSFSATLARLTGLRVLRLVSLGIWGALPSKIHRLSSLELLDLSFNFLCGSIPPKISVMVKLQTLALDGNFLNGTVPDHLDSLSNLTSLSLRNNQLSGPIPPSIQKITSLTNLALCNNSISGELPDLSGLNSLYMLDLSGNKINSGLPSLPKGVVMASLGHNSFSGAIPRQYSQLTQLQHLDLSFNLLIGTVPAAVFSLPNISYLNLESNMLNGQLPDQLSCSSKLELVDISNNRLTGGLPSCLNTTLNQRDVKFGGNCLSIQSQPQHPESFCIEGQKKQSKDPGVAVLAGIIGGVLVVALFLAFFFLVMCRRYCPRGMSEQHLLQKAVQENPTAGFSSELLTSARFISQASKLGTEDLPMCRLFTLEELKEATHNFDKSTCIGEGSNGKLYRGRLENGIQVAIRCLPLLRRDSIRNLKLRLDLLAKLRHPHLVCLLGHCIDGSGQDDFRGNRVFLVYEYVSNGNFRAHLSESYPEKALKWSERLAVLIGVAKAVHFLHTGVIPGFFNNRLKTNNVLLNEHRVAKLSDYGLSIITEDIDKHEVKGEGPKSWPLKSLEDDVFNFGLILLESLVGPSVSARRDAFLLNEMESLNSQDGRRRIVDPIVLNTCTQESLSIMISITNKCISPESTTRPSFEDVLWNLQYAAQAQAATDGD
ncbi:probable inactive leucine-rich repeat receptor-like protein kinase At3g03770 [Malania oleifera]|uniref:probable inactive leucine-rich repeat receptor-like protein kinase At3g03770 n=1 Tax=Malania oleifera TaxID=397392 RepID=UPI0025AE6991|nr:probable inactive leucine-rich repeat receptor-like protein kinase At3g03770 [Malania oleifera]